MSKSTSLLRRNVVILANMDKFHGKERLKALENRCHFAYVEHTSREDIVSRLRKLATERPYEAMVFSPGFWVYFNTWNEELFGPFSASLKLVVTPSAGYDHIDVAYLTKIGTYLANSPVAVAEPTAMTSLMLILQTVRATTHAEMNLRGGKWRTGLEFTDDIRDMTVGIIGNGRIGQKKLQALGVGKVIYYSRHRLPPSVIDEEALVRAMKSGQIAGVGLDVYENEPEVHPYLMQSERATLFPVPYFGRTLGDPDFDWVLKTVPQASVDGRRIPLPRGKTLGGTSVINSMTWFRGVREDYDILQELGNPGWGWNDWMPYFCKSETLHPPRSDTWALENAATFEPDISGTNGPLQRSFVSWLGDTHIPFLQSLGKLGLRANSRANAGYNIGAFTVTATVDPKTSRRSNVTTAYFEPKANRPNLHVLLGAHADRVTLRQPAATTSYEVNGVEFIHSSTRYKVFATKEVVISAGTLDVGYC
ncbi:hypothetical protein FRC07_004034 [Ceratobasidium sp. 392]|nr:hypothetical protein FRC07_004034 [Ceratobasidium sp. 392]